MAKEFMVLWEWVKTSKQTDVTQVLSCIIVHCSLKSRQQPAQDLHSLSFSELPLDGTEFLGTLH